MKFLAALLLSLAIGLPAAPSMAQPAPRAPDWRGQRQGPPMRRGPETQQPPSRGPDPRGPDALGPDSLGANWGGQQDQVRAGVRQGRYMPLAQVIGQIHRHTPGRQLDAGLEQWGGRDAYRVRWATPDGRRMDYLVDAHSGAVLHIDGR
jgi:hypothetical protein